MAVGILVGQIAVQILYKRPEIPANNLVLAIAISATYRKHEKAENPGSIPVSATKYLRINKLRLTVQRQDSRLDSC